MRRFISLVLIMISFIITTTPPALAQEAIPFLNNLEVVSAKNVFALFPIVHLPMKASPSSVAFHGETLVIGVTDNTVIVCQLPCLTHDEYKTKFWVSKALISPDGQWLAAATSSDKVGEVVLWQLKDGHFVAADSFQYQGLNPYIHDLAFSPNSSLVVAGNADGILDIRDIRQRELLPKFPLPNGARASMTSLMFFPDGSRLVSGYTAAGCPTFDCKWYSELQVWDMKSQPIQLVGNVDGDDWSSEVLALSPDGSLLVSSGHKLNVPPSPEDGTIHLWDTKTFPITGKPATVIKGYTHDVDALMFTHSGDILISASGDGTLRFWDIAKQQQIRVLGSDSSYPDSFETVVSLAFDTEGKVLASADYYRKTVTIWGVRHK